MEEARLWCSGELSSPVAFVNLSQSMTFSFARLEPPSPFARAAGPGCWEPHLADNEVRLVGGSELPRNARLVNRPSREKPQVSLLPVSSALYNIMLVTAKDGLKNATLIVTLLF